MCMKKFDAEKLFLVQTDMAFNLAMFRQLHLVSNGW